MRWYKLEETARPTANCSPTAVPALELAGFSESRQWWPIYRSGTKAVPAAAPAALADGDADMALELEDGDADDEEIDVGPEEEDPEPDFLALLDPILDAYEEPIRIADPTASPAPATPTAAGSEAEPRPDTSAAAPDPPPLPPPAARPPARKRQRTGVMDTVESDMGSIVYFYSNGNFEARCRAHADERCTLSHMGKREGEAASSSGPTVCRPLGWMSAWLGAVVGLANKEQHKGKHFLPGWVANTRGSSAITAGRGWQR